MTKKVMQKLQIKSPAVCVCANLGSSLWLRLLNIPHVLTHTFCMTLDTIAKTICLFDGDLVVHNLVLQPFLLDPYCMFSLLSSIDWDWSGRGSDISTQNWTHITIRHTLFDMYMKYRWILWNINKCFRTLALV